jgi:hypothetical protein
MSDCPTYYIGEESTFNNISALGISLILSKPEQTLYSHPSSETLFSLLTITITAGRPGYGFGGARA